MKNILKSVLIIALAGALSGCYPTERRAAKVSAGLAEIMSETEKIDNFSVSLTLPESYPSELPKITTAGLFFNEESVFDTLLAEEPFEVFRREIPDDEPYPGETATNCRLDEGDEAYLLFKPELVDYHSARHGKLAYWDLISDANHFKDQDEIKYVSELEGFSSEEAILRVRETAEKLGIKHLGEPEVFGITAENANKYFSTMDARDEYNGKTPEGTRLTSEDEAYYLIFPLVYENIPRATSNIRVAEYYYDTDSYVKAIVTKDEIVTLECLTITSPEYTTVESIPIKFSAEDILRTIVSDHSNIVHSEAVEYYNCKLVYVPEKYENGEWTLIPAWEFDYCTHDTRKSDYYKNVVGELPEIWWITRDFYNANTGNLILWGY